MKLSSNKLATGTMTFAALLAMHAPNASAMLVCSLPADERIAREDKGQDESTPDSSKGIAKAILDLFGAEFDVLCGGSGVSRPPVVACETAPATPRKN